MYFYVEGKYSESKIFLKIFFHHYVSFYRIKDLMRFFLNFSVFSTYFFNEVEIKTFVLFTCYEICIKKIFFLNERN